MFLCWWWWYGEWTETTNSALRIPHFRTFFFVWKYLLSPDARDSRLFLSKNIPDIYINIYTDSIICANRCRQKCGVDRQLLPSGTKRLCNECAFWFKHCSHTHIYIYINLFSILMTLSELSLIARLMSTPRRSSIHRFQLLCFYFCVGPQSTQQQQQQKRATELLPVYLIMCFRERPIFAGLQMPHHHFFA